MTARPGPRLGRSLLRGALGLLAGLGLAGFVHGGLELVSPEAGWWRESVALATGGNLLAGLALLPGLLLLVLLSHRRGTWTLGRPFLVGVALGLLPVLGTLLLRSGLYRGHATVAVWALPVLLFLVARIPARRLPGARAVGASWLLVLGAWFLSGGRGLEPAFPVDGPSGDPELRALFARPGGPQVDAAHPDIVLISLDTARADALTGPQRARVPQLDALAARGLVAPYARSGSNCTLPGHIEMFTGVGPLRHGILNNSGLAPEELPTLGALFAEAGWNTAAVISNRVIERRFGPSRGFQLWHDALGTAHNHLARLGENTLLGWLSDRELFARLHTLVFFGQEGVQAEWGAREAERTAQTALARIEELSASPRPYLLVVQFMDAHAPYRAPAGFLGTRAAAPGPAMPGFDATRARYWEEIDYLDSQLGRVFARLQETDRPHVILVTGDHGEHLGEQQMVGHSDELFEPVVRVPFFLAGSGVPVGTLEPVSLIDVAPTLLALAGIPVPATMEGRDVRTRVGASPDPERFLFARDERSVSAVLGGRWKWAADWRRGAETPEEGLFRDLLADPGEEGPAVEAPIGALDEIKRRLGQAILRHGGGLDPERRAALARLGYVDSASE